MTRASIHDRSFTLGPLALLAWALAGACASEGDETSVLDLPDASVDAEPADTPVQVDPGDGGDAALVPPGCSEDGWCVVTLPELEATTLSAVWGSGPSDVWAVGSAGTIAHYDGATWAVLPKTDGGTEQTLFTVWGSGPNDVWAGSTERVLFHTDGWKQGHATWSLVEGSKRWQERLAAFEQSDPAGKLRVWALWGTGPNDVWMFSNGTIRAWHAGGYGDGAVDWIPVLDYFPGTSIAFKGAWGSGPNDLWVVGGEGKILHSPTGYHDEVVDWEIVNSGTHQDLNAIWGTAPDDIWAVGRVGAIRHYTYDAGDALRWVPTTSGVDAELRAIWGTGANDVWVVGDSATILHGDGASWSRSRLPPLPEATAFRGIWGSGANDVWVVGDGVILHRGPTKAGQVQ